MMKHPSLRAALVASIVTLVATGACSDQGVVPKTDTPKSTTSTTQAPPLVSGRGDAGALPPGHPPVDAAAPSIVPPVPANAGTGDTAMAWRVPAGWTAEKPTSAMRRAQYRVPGTGGDGECAVFYFGPRQGGDAKSNAERWADQFALPDGGPARSAMKTSEISVNGMTVVIVEVAGTYNGGMTMTAAPATPKPGYRLLGAVAPGPDANWFFKFTGPDATVSAQREAFLGMVKSLKPGPS